MSDEQEFMELAQKNNSVRPNHAEQAVSSIGDEQKKPGSLVQYTELANGYMPTSRTMATLPPGVYDIAISNAGAYFAPRNIVTDKLLRLPDSKSDEVISEIDEFWKKKDQFKKFGLAHKRGFLLWGPPGSGKTSTIAKVSKQLVSEGDLVIVGQSTSPNVLALMLGQLRQVEPERRLIVLLEDLDTIIYRFGESETLALLDGESSIDNVVFIATTNYPENLDGRVVNRPSRFDKVVKIGMPSPEARALYLKSRGVEGDLTPWVELTNGFSIAHLKELVIGVCCFGGDLVKEVERLRGMAKAPKSDEPKAKAGF